MSILIKSYIRALLETADKDFMKDFLPVYDEWMELQSQYGPIHSGPWVDPETGEEHWPEGQKVPKDEQPDYVKDNPGWYDSLSDHPSTRRASFSQTKAEVDIEKKLLSLFQKHANQSFFQGITLYHDLNYRAAVSQPFGDKLDYADFNRSDYFDLEGKRNKDVMSCHGSIDGSITTGGYGIILKGHTVFASEGDLGSQTLRTAHKKIKDKHKSSGLPKRTGPEKVHPSEKRIDREIKRREFQRRIAKRRGKEIPPELTRELATEMLNTVVLDSNDVKGNNIEEILLDNWTIEGWYCKIHDGVPWPEDFWRKAVEAGIEKPVYAAGSGKLKQIDIKKMLGVNESKNHLKNLVREIIAEDAMGFVHDLAAASDEFGEEGQPFFGGNPGKAGGKAIKRAFNANADHQWLSTLDTVHWTSDLEMLPQLATKSKDELSANMVLPSEDFPPESGEYGLWIKGRITLATNDMDDLYSGFHKDYGAGKEGTEEEVAHRDRSSGRNKRPTVSKDYSRYGNLKRGTEFGEKMAKNIPYVLDKTMWAPDDWNSNEALVDNWRPVGIVVTYDDQAYAIQNMSDLKTEEDIREHSAGIVKMILMTALKMGLPIYDLGKDEIWSPK